MMVRMDKMNKIVLVNKNKMMVRKAKITKMALINKSKMMVRMDKTDKMDKRVMVKYNKIKVVALMDRVVLIPNNKTQVTT